MWKEGSTLSRTFLTGQNLSSAENSTNLSGLLFQLSLRRLPHIFANIIFHHSTKKGNDCLELGKRELNTLTTNSYSEAHPVLVFFIPIFSTAWSHSPHQEFAFYILLLLFLGQLYSLGFFCYSSSLPHLFSYFDPFLTLCVFVYLHGYTCIYVLSGGVYAHNVHMCTLKYHLSFCRISFFMWIEMNQTNISTCPDFSFLKSKLLWYIIPINGLDAFDWNLMHTVKG